MILREMAETFINLHCNLAQGKYDVDIYFREKILMVIDIASKYTLALQET